MTHLLCGPIRGSPSTTDTGSARIATNLAVMGPTALLAEWYRLHHVVMFASHAGDYSPTLEILHLGTLTVVSESDSLSVVAKAFLNTRTSCAVLREPPLRVVTERDLVGAWADGRSADEQIGLISSTHPCWIPATASVVEAAAQMINLGVRHLVVLDITGRPTGIISMVELFSSLVHNQEPLALYASFDTLMVQGGSLLSNSSATNDDSRRSGA